MNKKLLLLLMFALTFNIVNAQEDEIFGNQTKTTQSYTKNTVSLSDSNIQEAGNKSFEVSFNPGNIFGSSEGNVFSLINGGIKFRKFSTSEKATRIGLNLSYMSNNNIIQEEDTDNGDLELKEYGTKFQITLIPGFEKHYMVSNKISPYTGVQFLLGYGHTSYSVERQKSKSIYSVSWINDPSKMGSASLDVGVGFVTGVDYYFIKNFYVGVEIGYGLQYSKLLSTKFIDEDDSDNDIEVPNGSGFRISPSLSTGNIRLGWTF